MTEISTSYFNVNNENEHRAQINSHLKQFDIKITAVSLTTFTKEDINIFNVTLFNCDGSIFRNSYIPKGVFDGITISFTLHPINPFGFGKPPYTISIKSKLQLNEIRFFISYAESITKTDTL